MTKRPGRKVVHGDDLLYRFFLDVLATQPELFAKVPKLMLESMAIWLPLDVYYEWPVLLPWVVRDPRCRGNLATGRPDEWGSPDKGGYLRDDNSLIKAIPRGLSVRTPKAGRLRGARMGTKFVAAHVWRVVNHSQLASTLPLLNSFVPNLVWLPSQVAKLTDREGGVVQTTLQSMAFAIYRDAPVAPHLQDVVSAAWAMIPEPTQLATPLSDLNWFESSDQFFATRRTRLQSVVAGLEMIAAGMPITTDVITSRYTVGLPSVAADARGELLAQLRRYQHD